MKGFVQGNAQDGKGKSRQARTAAAQDLYDVALAKRTEGMAFRVAI
ncbi:hypothetical protein [Propionispora hippei]|uniref:Uncharacterized protein n=1 Tax=Propionispora hippei DSM 15287 TaxID=1123003 RepID=A0A1M6MCK1_9FIRM|nr:hypothetical protein [Propionispora hippei]SHJ81013.1 hypothetical protein SAMN02745170_03391 [Propionispora hippei DSM 15287]